MSLSRIEYERCPRQAFGPTRAIADRPEGVEVDQPGKTVSPRKCGETRVALSELPEDCSTAAVPSLLMARIRPAPLRTYAKMGILLVA